MPDPGAGRGWGESPQSKEGESWHVIGKASMDIHPRERYILPGFPTGELLPFDCTRSSYKFPFGFYALD